MTPNEEQTIRTMLGEHQDKWSEIEAKYNAVKYRYDKVAARPLSTEILAWIVGTHLACPPGEEPDEPEYDDSNDGDKLCVVMFDGIETQGHYLGWAREDLHKVKFAKDDKQYRMIKAEDFVTPIKQVAGK